MPQLTPEQQKKIGRLAKTLGEGNVAILGYINDLEDKIDAELPALENRIETKVESTIEKVDTKLEKALEEVKKSSPDLNNILEQVKGRPGVPGPKGDSIKGDKGDNYILTQKDKEEIASTIKVPIVEKIIEIQKTEIIKEIPIVKENIVQVALKDTPEETRDKLETLKDEDRLDASAIKNLPKAVKDISHVGGFGGIKEVVAGTGITVNNSNLGYPVVSASGSGDVVGPSSATDNAVARFDTTTGKLIQNSGVIIDDSNNVTGVLSEKITSNAIGTANTIGLTLENTTNATGGVPMQASPGQIFLGKYWTGSVTATSEFLWQNRPQSSYDGHLFLYHRVNGGSYTRILDIIASTGDITFGGNITGIGQASAGIFNATNYITSSGDVISTGGNLSIYGSGTIGTTLTVGTNIVAKTYTYASVYDNGTQSGNFTVDWNNGSKQKVTISGTNLQMSFTAPPGPANLELEIIQNSGGDTIDFSAGTVQKFPGGTPPTLSGSAGNIDILSISYNGTNYNTMFGLNFS